jgi:hypothetical protein
MPAAPALRGQKIDHPLRSERGFTTVRSAPANLVGPIGVRHLKMKNYSWKIEVSRSVAGLDLSMCGICGPKEALLDHLISAGEQCGWDGEAKHLGCADVDD